MSKDNGCEIKFNICGYFPASENPREIPGHVPTRIHRKNYSSQYLRKLFFQKTSIIDTIY